MASGVLQIKVPQRDGGSKVEKALLNVKHDGEWHRLLTMGFTSAEQTARAYNGSGPYEMGYTHEVDDSGALASVLWARWVA